MRWRVLLAQVPPLLITAAAVAELQHPGLATGGLFWPDLADPALRVPTLVDYLSSLRTGVHLRSDVEALAMRDVLAPAGVLACLLPTTLVLVVRRNICRTAELATRLFGDTLGLGGARLDASAQFSMVRLYCSCVPLHIGSSVPWQAGLLV